MCSVSAVLGYGQTVWPLPQQVQGPVIGWAEYNELVRKAKEFDRISQQPDCHDPQKDDWYRQMEERVHKLEQAEK